MKAVLFDRFGASDVLRIGEVQEPTPGPGEVRIRLTHTSVNPVDWKIREGYLQEMIPHELPIVPGWDASGVIDQVGEGVDFLEPGDEVFAYARTAKVKYGTYAEKTVLPANSVAKRPTTITPAEAAAVPLTALTAWQSLHDLIGIEAGEKILVTAGAGGVGSFAVQFAKLAGATVITTASARNHDYLESLGADHTIDYTTGDVSAEVRKIAPEGVDAVFDAAGGQALAEAFRLVAKGGRLVSIVDTPDQELAKERGVKADFHFVYPSADQLQKIAELIDGGHLTLPAITTGAVKDAGRHLDENRQGHTRGKVVLEIAFD